MTLLLQQFLKGQAELTTKFESLESKFHNMENKVIISSASHPEQSPGSAHANAITLRSGRELEAREPDILITEDSEIQDGGGFNHNEVQTEIPRDRLDMHTRPATRVAPDESTRSTNRVKQTEPTKPATPKEKKLPYAPPPYVPKLPFPGRFKKELLEKYRSLFAKQIKEIEVKMPLLDAFALMPHYQKYMKDAVLERNKEIQGMVVLSHECSAIIQKKVVHEILGDPGSFTLPCSIGALEFQNCLWDPGASVSFMPLSIAQNPGFNEVKPCTISLVLADKSIRSPHDLLKDLLVKNGKALEERCEGVVVVECVVDKHLGITSINEVSIAEPMKILFGEIRMNEFRGWFYDEYDPGDTCIHQA